MVHQPQTDDIRFVLFNVLDAAGQLSALAPHAHTDADLMQQVLEEAARFVADKVAPLRREGDEIGCHFEQGTVTTPPGSKEAYQDFWQSGWASLSCAEEDGGQALPEVLNQVLYEMLSAANHGWTMAPGLLHGAYECIKHHASPPLKDAYLGKVATGEWLATMCLTEAHAGSDLGLVRTKAVPAPQAPASLTALGEVFQLEGTKIFISGGEHDLTDNIVHLVLARLHGPGIEAPPGPKGLSLFLAPKWLPDGSRNAVVCERIEEKMGIHASPTCVMRFENASGWLVGEPGKGLGAMFVMMNAARLHVGLQGVGLLEAAWQMADAYAKERRQMRAPSADGSRPADSAGQAADLIVHHPAVRRILDTQRAWVDGGRVIAYQTALELDVARHHPDPARQARAQRWCALVTPVLKAAFTHQAFHGGSDCLQVFGGHGYVREWGIEQVLRDARIAMIYEGTNEIQGIDLLVRKVVGDQGQALYALLDDLAADLTTGAGTASGPQVDPVAAPLADRALALMARLREATATVLARHAAQPEQVYWVADDFLPCLARVLLAWAWVRIARTAGADAARWQAPRAALSRWVLDEFDLHLGRVLA
ncbi:acyl-CoA dehydrogenase family protein [Hydrogenophaga soli]